MVKYLFIVCTISVHINILMRFQAPFSRRIGLGKTSRHIYPKKKKYEIFLRREILSFFIIQQTRFLLCYYFDCHQIDRSFFLNSALSAVNLWQKVSLNGIEWQQTEFCFIYFFFFFFHPFEGLWSVSKDDLLINKAIDTSLSFLFFLYFIQHYT